MVEEELIIEIPYAGLGDHLFFSHLPKIAKESGYKKVYISSNSPFRHPDYKKIVWEYNPYIDGFIDQPGKSINIEEIINFLLRRKEIRHNLLDEIMYKFDLDNNKKWNEPEVYYKPQFIEKYNKVIYDPNYLSWVGDVSKEEAQAFIIKKDYHFDAIMKIRSEKHLIIPENYQDFIETPTLEDFCNLIYSSKKLYCLTSGTATLAAALGIKAHVFYGINQPRIFQHSKKHFYEKITPFLRNRLRYLFYNPN